MNINASNGVMNVGHQLDNLATVISFDMTEVLKEYGTGGTFYVYIQRYGDVAGYPTNGHSLNGTTLNLILTSSDLAKVGEGQIQIKYVIGSRTIMSRVYRFYSHYSLNGSAEVPEPWVSWVEEVEENAEKAQEAVEHYPYVDTTTKHWMQYDVETETFVDTGIVAEGQDGEDGADGSDGTTFTPSVSAEGVISWTNDGGKQNPTPVNIKGAKGDDGEDGEDGEDGYSPSATVSKVGNTATIVITDKDGTTTAQVSDGTTPDMSAYYTKTQTDTLLSDKADADDVYTKSETDSAISAHHDSQKQDATDNALNTTNKTIVGAINEVDSIALGANQAVSYGNISTMVSTLNAMASTQYHTGQNIYIVTTEVPDVWVSNVEQTSVPYTYTTDDAFITELSTNGYVQIGYYKVSMLETQKVDLTSYRTASAQDVIDATKVNGVKVAGTELVKDGEGKVNVPVGNGNTKGVVYANPNLAFGIYILNGELGIYGAEDANIINRTTDRPITPKSLDKAIKYGLTSNTQITTDADKKSICNTIGALCSIPKTALDNVAVVGSAYYLGSQSTVAIVLPSTPSAGDTISVVFYSGATAATLSVTGTYLGTLPTPSTNQRIELSLLYDGTNWCLLSNVMAVA